MSDDPLTPPVPPVPATPPAKLDPIKPSVSSAKPDEGSKEGSKDASSAKTPAASAGSTAPEPTVVFDDLLNDLQKSLDKQPIAGDQDQKDSVSIADPVSAPGASSTTIKSDSQVELKSEDQSIKPDEDIKILDAKSSVPKTSVPATDSPSSTSTVLPPPLQTQPQPPTPPMNASQSTPAPSMPVSPSTTPPPATTTSQPAAGSPPPSYVRPPQPFQSGQAGSGAPSAPPATSTSPPQPSQSQAPTFSRPAGSIGAMPPPSDKQSSTSGSVAPPPAPPGSPPPAVPKSPQDSGKPELKQADVSNVKKSSLRLLPLILGVLVVLGAIAFFALRFFNLGPFSQPTVTPPISTQTGSDTPAAPAAGSQTAITYWGLWESNETMSSLITEFENQNPGVTINYQQQQAREYRERLQDAIQRGSGPDIFRYHASWVPMLRNQLAPAPATVLTTQTLSSDYFPAYSQDIVRSGAVLGMPLMYEGLALYYNKEVLALANATPPTSWSELETLAKQLTIKTGTSIDRAGVAIGTTGNVDNFSDILGLMILQNAGDPAKPTDARTKESMQYYSSFARTHQVWDSALPSSTYAFATEKVAMILAPSWRALEIRAINPNLDFGVAPVPQLPGANVAWASYWVEGVSSSSRNQEAAWKFLSFLGEQDSLQEFSTIATQNTPRLFGPIFPRTTLADSLATDPYLGAFVSDAPIARSWYLSSRTFDNGINDRIIKYYEDAINSIAQSGSSIDIAAATAEQGIQQVLVQFGVIAAPPVVPAQ